MAHSRLRTVVALLAACLVLGACTEDMPDTAVPTPVPTGDGDTPPADQQTRVAVIVGPGPDDRRQAQRDDLLTLSQSLPAGSDLEVYLADPGFERDLAAVLVDEQFELVCMVDVSLGTVRQIANAAPDTRFCAFPVVAEVPANVLPIDLRVEEVGHVIGRAAVEAAPGWPVGLLTNEGTFDPARLRSALEAAVTAAAPGTAVVAVDAIDGAEAARVQANALLDDGVAVLVSMLGAADLDVLEVASGRDVGVPSDDATGPTGDPTGDPTEEPTPGPFPTPTTAPPPPSVALGTRPTDDVEDDSLDDVLAIVDTDPAVAVAVAIGRHLEGWTTERATVGLAQGAVMVTAPATELGDRVRELIEATITGILDGTIDLG